MFLLCGLSMTSWVYPYPFIESIYILRFESIHTLFLRLWNDQACDRLNKRVWTDSIKGYGSTQDVIDGPHCVFCCLNFPKRYFLLSFQIAKLLVLNCITLLLIFDRFNSVINDLFYQDQNCLRSKIDMQFK